MPQAQVLNHAFNRGEVSIDALARVDAEALRLACETQENIIGYVIGKAMLRPGFGYIGTAEDRAELLEFVFSVSDKALIELTENSLRVFSGDEVISRASVSTAVTSGDFSASTGWTLDGAGGASATVSGGFLRLESPSLGGRATATQEVSVAGGDTDKEHGVRVTVTKGPVTCRIGSTSGDDDYISTTTLRTGAHSLSLSPSGSFFIQFESTAQPERLVDACEIEAGGDMALPTPWTESDFGNVRYAQSADILFVACAGLAQRRIERRGDGRSWSVCLYSANDGPFRLEASADLTLTPDGNAGDVTITASSAFFRPEHEGSLLRLVHFSLDTSGSVSAENTFTEPFEVFGVGNARIFRWTISGLTGTSTTVTLQRSFDGPDSGFQDVESKTSNITSEAEDDNFDNQSVWYRAGVKTGDYSSGTIAISFAYPGGGGAGVVRVTSRTSATEAECEVLVALKSTTATRDWLEGEWSDRYGFPAAVAFFDGRLWWAGRDRVWGSVSDAYSSFDVEVEGDSGPILRNVATGAVNQVRWLLSLQRLMIGTEGAEVGARSSTFDEPLTPSAFALKNASTLGSAAVNAAQIDTNGIFVQRSGARVYELIFDAKKLDYSSTNLTRLNDEIAGGGFSKVAVQRQPDSRAWFVRADGQLVMLLYEGAEGVQGWFRAVTDGEVESVAVLPGDGQDDLYIAVKRTIEGQDVRYIEKMARDSEALGGAITKLADSFVFDAGPASSVTAAHLASETGLVGWATDGDGQSGPLADLQADGSGNIALGGEYTDICVGLPYSWRLKSAKLAYGSAKGTSLLQKKIVQQIGLLLRNTHMDAIQYGRDFTNLNPMPKIVGGRPLDANTVHDTHDAVMAPFPGSWDTDSRICLTGAAPYPATVLGVVFQIDTNDK